MHNKLYWVVPGQGCKSFTARLSRGAWVAQSAEQLTLVLAEFMISEWQDQAPCRAPCSVRHLPLPLSLSFPLLTQAHSLSKINKYIKSLKIIKKKKARRDCSGLRKRSQPPERKESKEIPRREGARILSDFTQKHDRESLGQRAPEGSRTRGY